jgi:hypothetical protein
VVGASFNEIATKASHIELPERADQLSNLGYLVVPGKSKNGRDCVLVAFKEDVSPTQQAKAYVHATLLSRHIQYAKDVNAAEINAFAELHAAWPFFLDVCGKSGWDLAKTELRSQGYELSCQTA